MVSFSKKTMAITISNVYFNYYIEDKDSPPTTTYTVYAILETSEGNFYYQPITATANKGPNSAGPLTFTYVVEPNPLPMYPYRINVLVIRNSDSAQRTGVSDWTDESGLQSRTPDPIKVQEF